MQSQSTTLPAFDSTYGIALEKQLEALNLTATILTDKARDRVAKEIDVLNLMALQYAEPFYVSRNICELIEAAGRGLPDVTIGESDLFTPAGFAWFAKPLSIPEEYDHLTGSDSLLALAWCAVNYSDDGARLPSSDHPANEVVVIPFPYYPQITRLVPAPMTVMTWPFGKSLNYIRANAIDAIHNDRSISKRGTLEMAYFAAAMALFGQQLLVSRRERASRATRRRAAEVWKTEKLVNVVELRRKTIHKDNPGHAEVEWSHQWLVRGHWRNQWYPSAGRHQPVWVSPYVKGPEDKPLLPSRNRVFAVVR